LLDQIDGGIGKVTADGAYDGAPTYATIAAHGDDIDVVIPPRSTAVPGDEAGPPTQRDRHLDMISDYWLRVSDIRRSENTNDQAKTWHDCIDSGIYVIL
jgi:hypothetical protein